MTASTARRRSVFAIFNPFGKPRRGEKKRWPRRPYRPWLEALENRLAPALTINVVGTTQIDETSGLQGDDVQYLGVHQNDGVPDNVEDAFSAAGVTLATAIQVAGGDNKPPGNPNDLTVTGLIGTFSGFGFTDANGNALDGDGSGLFTLENKQIFLYVSPTNDNIVLGREGTNGTTANPSGDIVFSVYLEETGTPSSPAGRFWTALFEPLKHTNANDPDDFLDLGNNLKVAASESISF